MLIVLNDVTLLTIDSVLSLLIKTTPKIETVLRTKGFLGLFPKYETIEEEAFTLELVYTLGKTTSTFTQQSKSYDLLKKNCKSIICQVQQYDSTYIDRAFEEVLKE